MIPKIKIFDNKFGNPNFSFSAILVMTGSIFEEKHESGISHFIEHLLFKGSKYYQDMKNFTNKLNSQGMITNAFTSNYITLYHIDSQTKDISDAIDSLVQMVFNPLFREKDIDEERKVVINELLQRNSSPSQFNMEKVLEIIYKKDNPLHNQVIGDIPTLEKIDKDDILTYYHKYYQPKNMMFISITNKDKHNVKKLWTEAYQKYSNLSTNRNNDFPSTMEIFKSITPKMAGINKPGFHNLHRYFPKNNTYFTTINFLFPRPSNKKVFELSVFSSYLAGSLSSKLFDELRTKKQLIYGISSGISLDNNYLILTLAFNCKKNKKVLEECIKTIDQVIKESAKDGIPPEEFKKFHNKYLISMERDKSSSFDLMMSMIYEKLFNFPSMDTKLVKNITNSDLHSTIRELFSKAKIYTIIV